MSATATAPAGATADFSAIVRLEGAGIFLIRDRAVDLADHSLRSAHDLPIEAA